MKVAEWMKWRMLAIVLAVSSGKGDGTVAESADAE